MIFLAFLYWIKVNHIHVVSLTVWFLLNPTCTLCLYLFYLFIFFFRDWWKKKKKKKIASAKKKFSFFSPVPIFFFPVPKFFFSGTLFANQKFWLLKYYKIEIVRVSSKIVETLELTFNAPQNVVHWNMHHNVVHLWCKMWCTRHKKCSPSIFTLG